MLEDPDRCYRILAARDQRFDGWFVAGVHTTGIYCRPSCPATTPRRRNVSFFATSAAAQGAGFRACKRCRPDASPGSPEWNQRHDLVARAMRLIADGVVDRDGVTGLAQALNYSERHLHRLLVTEVGAAPLALARAQRSQTARLLIETTDLPFIQVAFGAGFSSLRQFNDTVRAVFASTPTELRRRARRGGSTASPGPTGSIRIRLAVRGPFAAPELFSFLAARAVSGVECGSAEHYIRTLALAHGDVLIRLDAPREPTGPVIGTFRLEDVRDLQAAVARARRLLDADADPVAVDARLADDRLLRPSVIRTPGLRSVGSADPTEMAFRAVLGQQVSVASARATAARLASSFGRPVRVSDPGGPDAPDADARVSTVFPDADCLAAVDPETLPMVRSRARTLVALAGAIAEGDVRLDAGADRGDARESLLGRRGIGPWTADYIVMRALGDPDVMLTGDSGIRAGARRLGLGPADLEASQRWSPWRSYAVHHLWRAAATVTSSPPASVERPA